MYHKDRQVIFFTIFLIMGIILTMQFRSTLFSNTEENSTAFNVEKLKAELDAEKKEQQRLRDEISKYEKAMEDFLKAGPETAGYANEYDLLKNRLDAVNLMGGLTDVKGMGVTIKLNDALSWDNGEPADFIIHDSDIVKVLNELRASGAQAISINNERIIAVSGQVCTGPTIKINNNRYAVPYEIKAIGDADKLAAHLNESEIIQDMKRYNIRVEILIEKEIIIPAYKNELENLISGLEVVTSEN